MKFICDLKGQLLLKTCSQRPSQSRSRFALQLSSVYQTVRITHLCKLIPFGDFGYIEKVAVDAIKYGFLPAKIDHKLGTVRFGIQVSFHPPHQFVFASRRLGGRRSFEFSVFGPHSALLKSSTGLTLVACHLALVVCRQSSGPGDLPFRTLVTPSVRSDCFIVTCICNEYGVAFTSYCLRRCAFPGSVREESWCGSLRSTVLKDCLKNRRRSVF